MVGLPHLYSSMAAGSPAPRTTACMHVVSMVSASLRNRCKLPVLSGRHLLLPLTRYHNLI